MTTDTAAENTASQHVKPYRHLVAFTLVAAAGLQLLIDLVSLFLSEGSFRDRAAALGVVDVVTVGLPVVAVLLATHVAPLLKQGKAITLVALAELGIAGLLVLLSFVMGLMQQFDGIVARSLVIFLLSNLARFALIGIAIFFVVRVFAGEYLKSAPQAPAYGYPQQQYAGQPYPQPQQYGQGVAAATAPQHGNAAAAQAAYAQQAAYQQQAQPGYGQYGYPQQAQQQAAQPAQQQAPQQAQQQQQTGYQTPATYGQSTAPTSASPASSPPTSAAPASAPPTSAAPAYGYGQPQQQEAPQATAWPPAPPSTSQWPPTPAPKQQQQTEAASEDVQHTQMLRPETFRGNNSS